MELLRGLQAGLTNGEVTLAYQPKLDLRSGTICSAEALLRWARPGGQQVNIGDLVTLCEQTGTIRELTRWTAARAIADNEQFLAAGHTLLIFINVSGTLLADVGFADDLLKLLSQTPARIGIEITETSVIADPEAAISNLDRLAKAGIAIAIDDFGAGLASLEYLQRLPASELKIDRSFIAELSSSHRNPLITRATIDLAHALDMRVTAEGVDDQLSMALLKIMGCDMAQGYLISRPVEPMKFIDFLRSFNLASDQEMPLKDAK
jgi:EAL domain-containing protein (putative c-di-GMP-specific phosphodiesterase class I)